MKNNHILTLLGAVVILAIGYGLGSQGRTPSGGPSSIISALERTVKKPKPKYVKPVQPLSYTKPSKLAFLRVQRGSDQKVVSVDTATVSYEPISGADLQVDLVGAVHMADKAYFDDLNRQFKNYDKVLYELVAPPDTRPAPNMAKGTDPLSVIQSALPEMLGFSHQLDQIDYQASNFVHADLSFEDLVEEGKKRGETAFTLIAGMALDFLKVVQKMNDQQADKPIAPQPGMLDLLSNPNLFRQSFAEALALMEEDTSSIGGFTTLTPYLIEARNDEALRVLDSEIKAGNKKIAIFYGAAHLPDFEAKLAKEFGLKRAGSTWNKAWDLTNELPTKSPIQQIENILRLFQ